MNRVCATCAKHDTCFYSSEKVIDCTHHEPKSETNYERLFGTPERAAKTLSIMQRCELGIIGNCDECEMHDACRVRDGDYDALLGWLRGESE